MTSNGTDIKFTEYKTKRFLVEYTNRRDRMIFKVLYQESIDLAPVRERTKSLYVEAESEREVRQKLSNRNINIEFIQILDEVHLEYEKQSEAFEIESV